MFNLSVLHDALGVILEKKLSKKRVPDAVFFYEAGLYPPMGISDYIVKELDDVSVMRDSQSRFFLISNGTLSALVAWNFTTCHNVYVLRGSYFAERGVHTFTGVHRRVFPHGNEEIDFIVDCVVSILE